MTILCIRWEYEDKLPEMYPEEYALIFKKSEVRDGVRMFPYVCTQDEDGNDIRAFLA